MLRFAVFQIVRIGPKWLQSCPQMDVRHLSDIHLWTRLLRCAVFQIVRIGPKWLQSCPQMDVRRLSDIHLWTRLQPFWTDPHNLEHCAPQHFGKEHFLSNATGQMGVVNVTVTYNFQSNGELIIIVIAR